ncbi:cytochrome c biogenesis CcdA family protein [Candidatus Pelagibacter sp. HIMB1611]|uniref:cytochrome c biogenesis CcdA family protein n=1 Tax=unclassified Candidatus Pelagibacter TaxID=2647897 RepID=UPI003F825C1B
MIEYLIAFGAGLISFLSPCVLPLIPGYISFVSGQSLKEITEKQNFNIIPLIKFCFGFSLVFIIFGASASFLGQVLLENSQSLRLIAGLIVIFFSLQLIGVFNFGFLNIDRRFDFKKIDSFFFPVIIGAAFGFGWTPCIGPILGSILALASIEDTLSRAIILLSFYSLGLAIPFVLSGYLIQKFLIFSKNMRQYINIISKVGGAILLVTGILIITNKLQAIGFYLIEIFPFMQNFG